MVTFSFQGLFKVRIAFKVSSMPWSRFKDFLTLYEPCQSKDRFLKFKTEMKQYKRKRKYLQEHCQQLRMHAWHHHSDIIVITMKFSYAKHKVVVYTSWSIHCWLPPVWGCIQTTHSHSVDWSRLENSLLLLATKQG